MKDRVKKNSYFYTQVSLIFSVVLFIFSMNAMDNFRGKNAHFLSNLSHGGAIEARDTAIASALFLCIPEPVLVQVVHRLVQSYEDDLRISRYYRPLMSALSCIMPVSGPRQLAIDYMALTVGEQKKRKKQLEKAVDNDDMLGVENILKNSAFDFNNFDELLSSFLMSTFAKQKYGPNVARLLLAEGARLPSTRKTLLNDNVNLIEFVLNNNKKLDQKELESLLVYAVSDSTAKVVRCLLGVYAAKAREGDLQYKDFNEKALCNAVVDRINNIGRVNGIEHANNAVEVLKEVVLVGGFDSILPSTFLWRLQHNVVLVVDQAVEDGQRERDVDVELHVSKIFNRSKLDLKDKYGKSAEKLIKGYALSSPQYG